MVAQRIVLNHRYCLGWGTCSAKNCAGTLYTSLNLNFMPTLKNKNYYNHFIDEETEAQRVWLAQSLRAVKGEMRCGVGLAPKPMLPPTLLPTRHRKTRATGKAGALAGKWSGLHSQTLLSSWGALAGKWSGLHSQTLLSSWGGPGW